MATMGNPAAPSSPESNADQDDGDAQDVFQTVADTGSVPGAGLEGVGHYHTQHDGEHRGGEGVEAVDSSLDHPGEPEGCCEESNARG